MPKLEHGIMNTKRKDDIKIQPVLSNPPTLQHPNINLPHNLVNTKKNILF